MVTFLLRSAIAVLSFCLIVLPVQAARDTDSYDGNIFALYAGNGSLVPPAVSLAESQAAGRTSVIVYYLDDSSTSKTFSGAVSELDDVWAEGKQLHEACHVVAAGQAEAGAIGGDGKVAKP